MFPVLFQKLSYCWPYRQYVLFFLSEKCWSSRACIESVSSSKYATNFIKRSQKLHLFIRQSKYRTKVNPSQFPTFSTVLLAWNMIVNLEGWFVPYNATYSFPWDKSLSLTCIPVWPRMIELCVIGVHCKSGSNWKLNTCWRTEQGNSLFQAHTAFFVSTESFHYLIFEQYDRTFAGMSSIMYLDPLQCDFEGLIFVKSVTMNLL